MANLIDVEFLNNFSEVFVFLLIFSLVYGVLSKVNFFKLGDKGKGLNAILAIAIALLTLVSTSIRAVIGTMVPWFFVLFLFFFLMLISTMIFGTKGETLEELVKQPKVHTWIIIFGVIILLFSLGAGFGETLENEASNGRVDASIDSDSTSTGIDDELSTDTGNYESNLVRTLFHPKVLGLMLIGLIGLMASIFLTRED